MCMPRNDDNQDWPGTLAHFLSTLEAYLELLTTKGVAPQFALLNVFHPLLKRYNDGERTEELMQEMQRVA